jgi:hypothetical protein
VRVGKLNGTAGTSALIMRCLGKETRLLCHFILQEIILPRQARDKHRENSKKDAFLQHDPLRNVRSGLLFDASRLPPDYSYTLGQPAMLSCPPQLLAERRCSTYVRWQPSLAAAE